MPPYKQKGVWSKIEAKLSGVTAMSVIGIEKCVFLFLIHGIFLCCPREKRKCLLVVSQINLSYHSTTPLPVKYYFIGLSQMFACIYKTVYRSYDVKGMLNISGQFVHF